MQVEFNIRWGCVCSIKTVECGPPETAQTCGNQRCGGSLTETNQKVAATKVHGALGGQTPHLLWPTQMDVSRIPTRGPKLTPARATVKIRSSEGAAFPCAARQRSSPNDMLG